MVRHFFKTLIVFIVMIILGLIGVFLINHFDENAGSAGEPNNQIQLAE